MSNHAYESFFPFQTIRVEQQQAIEFILDAFIEQRKRVVICEMGTGTGKSAVGVTVAGYMNTNPLLGSFGSKIGSGAYVLTTQKILQQQYVDDFGPQKRNLLRSIKSSSNYTCLHYSDQSCGESRRVLNKLTKQLVGTEFFNCCQTRCSYKIEKQEFIDSTLGVTNFSYFLAETMYAKKLEPRQLLIIDEAHNVESELGKFIEVTFSEKFARDVLKCKMPSNNGQETIFTWIKKTYKPILEKHLSKLEKLLETRWNSNMEGFGEYSKQYDLLDKHICKVNRFITSYNSDNWIMNVIQPPEKSRAGKRWEFKPIDVAPYSHDALFRFGDNILLMSATIVDKGVFCRSVGLDPNDVAYLRLPSPFPIQNKPIHYLPAGSMSMTNIEQTLPILAKTVKLLLEQHKDDKGIIHCTNFRIAQFIFDHVKSDRLMIHDSDNRDQVLRNHTEGSLPTVLLSPSMMEGVDLRDDISRFQILCKVPFPYLGDKVIQKRKLKDPQWYGYQTAKSVIQAMGRSIRSETDHATSYILDADWDNFFSRNRSFFPSDFIRSIS
jgi:Rad3-related DNA helicase